jgi:hypothetical protein
MSLNGIKMIISLPIFYSHNNPVITHSQKLDDFEEHKQKTMGKPTAKDFTILCKAVRK